MIKSIEDAIQRVKGSYPSIYSKDDVTNLLHELMSDLDTEINDIVELDRKFQSKPNVDFDDLRSKLHDAISKRLDRMDNNEVVDFDSAEFSINYDNRVELDNIDTNTDSIVDEIDDAIRDVFEVFEETMSIEPTTEVEAN